MSFVDEKGASTSGDQFSTASTNQIYNADDELLARLGYKAEFRREFSMLETIAFSFSMMGGISSVSSTFPLTLVSGGHVGIIWGWFIPCFFVMAVALCMAELVSSMPTSAGPYYFSAKLSPPKYAPLASWVTGNANIAGQVTLMCGLSFNCAHMITSAIAVASDGAVVLSSSATFGIVLAILFCQGIICSSPIKVLARLNLVYLVVTGGTTVAAIVALLVCSGNNKVSTENAFTLFENHTGWANDGWAFLLAFTGPMLTLSGYDSAVHISEEVVDARRNTPIAIIISVASTAILGWLVHIAASFATNSVSSLLATPLPLPMAQLFLDVLGKRGMLAIWSFIIVVQFISGVTQGVGTSRAVFAFARDNALPGSGWWKQINPHTRTPVNAVWFVMASAAMFALPGLAPIALSSLAAATVISLYISYATPIFLRITYGRNTMTPGYFSLGKWSLPVGVIAVSWVAFIVVLFFFPFAQTPKVSRMNYAIVIIMGGQVLTLGLWVLSAHKWFHGPISNVDISPTTTLLNDTETL